MSWVEAGEGGVFIRVRVQPRASKARHAPAGDVLKVWVKAPPVEGRANRELVEYLAKRLQVAKSKVELRSGERGREKLLFVDGVAPEYVKERLGC